MSSPVAYDLQGQGGGTVLNAGTSYTGPNAIRWVQVITDTVLGGLVSASGNIANASRVVGPTLTGGLGIGGNFSSITVTTGVVIVYFV